jgi:hypothetical protein
MLRRQGLRNPHVCVDVHEPAGEVLDGKGLDQGELTSLLRVPRPRLSRRRRKVRMKRNHFPLCFPIGFAMMGLRVPADPEGPG